MEHPWANFVPTANNGLSFLGVSFNAGELVSRVQITTGNTILGPNETGSIGAVVMDDFIYGEPQAVIPEPGSILLFGTGLWGLWMGQRFRKSGTPHATSCKDCN